MYLLAGQRATLHDNCSAPPTVTLDDLEFLVPVLHNPHHQPQCQEGSVHVVHWLLSGLLNIVFLLRDFAVQPAVVTQGVWLPTGCTLLELKLLQAGLSLRSHMFFFFTKDNPEGPPTANRQPPPTPGGGGGGQPGPVLVCDTPQPPPPPPPRVLKDAVRCGGHGANGAKSPTREVVRSSAGASVVYPPFWGSFA